MDKKWLFILLFLLGVSVSYADTIEQSFTFPYGTTVPIDQPFDIQQTNCPLSAVQIQLISGFQFHFTAHNSSPNGPGTFSFYGPGFGNINALIGVFSNQQFLVVNEVSLPPLTFRVLPLQTITRDVPLNQFNEANLSNDLLPLFQGRGVVTLNYFQGNVPIGASGPGSGWTSHNVEEASRITIVYETVGACP